MLSSNDKNTGVRAENAAGSSIPVDLDRQFHLASAEISRDFARLAADFTAAKDSLEKFSNEDEREISLRLVQDLLFHCMGYAQNISLVLNRPWSERLNERLVDLFSDCFYQEFFPEDGGPASREYFKFVFSRDHLAFVRRIEQGDRLSLSPGEFLCRSIDDLMDSWAVKRILEHHPRQEVRDRISEFMERQAFLKISRILLSS